MKELFNNPIKQLEDIMTETFGEKKDCLFQYATKHRIFKDTELITRKEADKLWEDFQDNIKDNWDELSSPQMCIWINCGSNTDYHTVGREIDFRDCELVKGRFYRRVEI